MYEQDEVAEMWSGRRGMLASVDRGLKWGARGGERAEGGRRGEG